MEVNNAPEGRPRYLMSRGRPGVAGGGFARRAVRCAMLALVGAMAFFPAAAEAFPGGVTAAYPATIYVVRHAERSADPPDDPHLSEEGRRRALRLSTMLGGEKLTAVLSTDTRRTRETAEPVANAAGVEVGIYDPRDPTSLDRLLATPELDGEAVLVVGHSNTVPVIVEGLAGGVVDPIDDDEYDRLYRLDADGGGGWTVTLVRF
jgi:phosphohistidine phosphatase SixA